jgi:hypothetical protein
MIMEIGKRRNISLRYYFKNSRSRADLFNFVASYFQSLMPEVLVRLRREK